MEGRMNRTTNTARNRLAATVIGTPASETKGAA
jgi:hypothetical protein